jgi:hypothetical protein
MSLKLPLQTNSSPLRSTRIHACRVGRVTVPDTDARKSHAIRVGPSLFETQSTNEIPSLHGKTRKSGENAKIVNINAGAMDHVS